MKCSSWGCTKGSGGLVKDTSKFHGQLEEDVIEEKTFHVGIN